MLSYCGARRRSLGLKAREGLDPHCADFQETSVQRIRDQNGDATTRKPRSSLRKLWGNL